MGFLFFPKPSAPHEAEYREVCSRNNLKYIKYFSVLCCVIFTLHLLHHFRLGWHAFSAEMMPYSVICLFGAFFPATVLLLLRNIHDISSSSPIAIVVEAAFPFFLATCAIVLSVFGAQFGQGITPFPTIMMGLCFLLQGQLTLLLWIVLIAWLFLSFGLVITLDVESATPSVAIALTSAILSIVVANFMEKMRVEQFTTVVKLRNNNRQLRQLSNKDHLTGLLNRRCFDRTLDREIARSDRFGHALSLLMIDVDNFKSINDTFGHVYGDDVLKKVANSLKLHVREVDYVGRLGGDEFIVLLVETEISAAIKIAERMRNEVTKIKSSDGESIFSISVGHAQFENESMSAFIEKADKALYCAKREGKNRVSS